MKRFLILVGGFALSCCFVFSGCSNHSANTSDVDVAKGMGISSPDDIISSPVDPVKSAEEQPTIQPDFPKEEADKKEVADNKSTIANDVRSEQASDTPATSNSLVISAFRSLWKEKGDQTSVSLSEQNVKLLGTISTKFELYEIIPENASGDSIMTYQTYQGYTIVSGTRYQPSAFALYLFDKDKNVLYTIEDGAQLVDFSAVYNLLPNNMKKQ